MPPKPEPIASLEELRRAALFAEKMENLDEAEALWSELLARDEGRKTKKYWTIQYFSKASLVFKTGF